MSATTVAGTPPDVPPVEGGPGPDRALAPVRAALLAGVRAEADRLLADAEADAARRLADARAQAADLLAAARARGEADAAAVLAAETSAARRTARALVLAAQREAYERLRAEAREAVRRLLADPAERERLAGLVRARLGSGAVLRDDPDGGIRGESSEAGATRTVDASVAALVDRALAGLDGERLWTAG